MRWIERLIGPGFDYEAFERAIQKSNEMGYRLMPERLKYAYRLGYRHGSSGVGCDLNVFSDPSRDDHTALRSAYLVGFDDGGQEFQVM